MDNIEIQEDTQIEKAHPTELDPWVSMLTKPRQTIQYIIDSNPKKHVVWLAIIGGILTNLNKSINEYSSIEDAISTIFILGPLSGIFSLYISGLLIYLTGTWLKGKGTGEAIRAAYAWSILPVLWSMPLFIITLCMATYNFTWPLLTCRIFVFLWYLVTISKALAQVQGFKSAWMGFLNIILASIIPTILLLALILFMFAKDFVPLR